MKKIVLIGEILVEIMADQVGDGFMEPMALTGPFPSGAPAIFADQAARVGQPCAIVSAVGDDDFGRLNVARLKRDGVDVSAIGVDRDRPTGSAFVRYRHDGSRDFVFNIKHSACGRMSLNGAAHSMLETADHLHIMGSSLSTEAFCTANIRAAQDIKARGGSVSFDPNVRKEILDVRGVREAMIAILATTDLYLPSGDELTLLTAAKAEDAAIAELLSGGIKAIAHKKGAAGARFVTLNEDVFVPAFKVEEIDPTGAGDCFGGTFTALWLRAVPPREALMLAVAAGAQAVTRRGPMEGTSTLEALKRLCAQRAEVF